MMKTSHSLSRVGRNIDGFGLSPGITKDQRLGVENLMKKAFANLTGDLAGTYYPLTGMEEKVRQQLVDDHFLFMSGDANLKVTYLIYFFVNFNICLNYLLLFLLFLFLFCSSLKKRFLYLCLPQG